MNTSRYRREILISSKHALVIAFFNFLIFHYSIIPFLHSSIPSLFHYSIIPFLHLPFFHSSILRSSISSSLFLHFMLWYSSILGCCSMPNIAAWFDRQRQACVLCFNRSEVHVCLPSVWCTGVTTKVRHMSDYRLCMFHATN